MTVPLYSLGDTVAAAYPSGWRLGGRVIMVIAGNTANSYEVEFVGGIHASFDETNVKKS